MRKTNQSHFSLNDPTLARLLAAEEKRQETTLTLIPSENHPFPGVYQLMGSRLSDKYAEGYPGQRYYQGQKYIDQIEQYAIDQAKKAFQVPFANVQPLSGSLANLAVYQALLPWPPAADDRADILALSLNAGGHLSHGQKVSLTGRLYRVVRYPLNQAEIIDYQELAQLARQHRPRLIIAGITAYPRRLDWAKFAQISDEVGAYLLADIAHIAGLIVGGAYPSPTPWVDLITTTTQKTLRGPRGAIIMVTEKGLKKDPDLGQKINRAVFPGLQGGPSMHTIAAIGYTLAQTQTVQFQRWAQQVVKNAQALAQVLTQAGLRLVSGGTESHLLLLDLRPQKLDGKTVAEALETIGLITNANTIPHDPNPPRRPSGLRLGTPAATSRGMKEAEMNQIGQWISQVIRALEKDQFSPNLQKNLRRAVRRLTQRFPLPNNRLKRPTI